MMRSANHVQLAALPVVALALLLVPAAAAAQQGWQALQRPNAIAVMRHALAPGTGDPAGFELGDCSTQRNLSEAGRRQARAIGRAIRERGIVVARVLTSRWCRSRETAELLALAPVEAYAALDSFFAGRGDSAGQTARLRDFLASEERNGRLLLVTHQVNITALTGIYPAAGELVVIEVAADGRIEVRGTIGIEP